MSNTNNKFRIGTVFSFLILFGYTALALIPLYLMVFTSFIKLGGTFDLDHLRLIGNHFSFDNYHNFNLRVGGLLPRWLLNSFIVSTVPIASSMFFGMLAGYAMSKIKFPGREWLFWVIIATMTIPYFVTLIPVYEMVWKFRWVDSYSVLIIPGLAGIGTIFLSKQFMQTIPSALIESATVDGCSEIGVFTRIILPLSKPLMALLGIMGFVGAWSEYFWAYLVTNSHTLYTIQMGIVSIIGVDQNFAGDLDYGEVMAASVLASLPILILFLVAQKLFIKGLTIGAVKG